MSMIDNLGVRSPVFDMCNSESTIKLLENGKRHRRPSQKKTCVPQTYMPWSKDMLNGKVVNPVMGYYTTCHVLNMAHMEFLGSPWNIFSLSGPSAKHERSITSSSSHADLRRKRNGQAVRIWINTCKCHEIQSAWW